MSAAQGASARLRITETFLSLQGEADAVGWPTTFVRLTGCPLRCVWCDTAYAFQGGTLYSVDELLAIAGGYGVRHVCVTGGEPLAQPACSVLLTALCDAGYEVSLETSGALPFSRVDGRVQRVVDIKTPGSGERGRTVVDELALLTARDLVKFVIADRVDYEWSRARVRKGGFGEVGAVLFSPVHAMLAPPLLAQWILEDRLPVRFQLQLHKVLWGDVAGR